jgi:hypothetical protein
MTQVQFTENFVSINPTTQLCCEEIKLFLHKISWGFLKLIYQMFTLITVQSKGVWSVSFLFM